MTGADCTLSGLFPAPSAGLGRSYNRNQSSTESVHAMTLSSQEG
jgi:hypothetical protein